MLCRPTGFGRSRHFFPVLHYLGDFLAFRLWGWNRLFSSGFSLFPGRGWLLGRGLTLCLRRFRRLGGFGGCYLLGFLFGFLPGRRCNFHGCRGKISGTHITHHPVLLYPDLSPFADLPQLFHFGIYFQGGDFGAIYAGTGSQIKLVYGHIKSGACHPGWRRREWRWRRRGRSLIRPRLTAHQADK
jgi:hypothetical protein